LNGLGATLLACVVKISENDSAYADAAADSLRGFYRSALIQVLDSEVVLTSATMSATQLRVAWLGAMLTEKHFARNDAARDRIVSELLA
jgi:hypothetical protein